MPAPRNYLLGYGSILQAVSRGRNLAYPGDPIPVRVHGLRRSWNARGVGPGLTCTFLGVEEQQGEAINGVLAPVDDAELPALDAREGGYTRRAVDPDRIEFLWQGGERPAMESVMVYVTDDPQPPTAEFPIIQSYVDICLEGCLEAGDHLGTGEEFAREFLRSTAGWSPHWVNDRLFPRAPFRHVPKAGLIDRLLHEHCPAEFAAIRIE